MFTDDLQQYLTDKIRGILKVVDKLGNLDPQIDSIPTLISFYPLFLNGDEIRVQVGTRDRPRGLSVTECSFIAIISEDNIRFLTTEKMKLYMKMRWEKIPSALVRDIETKIVDYKNLEEWLREEGA